jgi:hypothetical protein
MEDISTKIANDFKRFINQYDYDPYEVVTVINQVLTENNVNSSNKKVIGVRLFDN